ncbi:hypothetical protein CTAYLR_009444 [Chrysophaeum taylorii]|uniref:Tyrosinase copper-binding domain-containing protein n=1 Tax=Chrysophaeum taylorii TaxID=2483200 RepID=A0AAD7U752_9STRA|nr:hypothetical protein CTAYLR_009444 [Chrysophaeum taylorii]
MRRATNYGSAALPERRRRRLPEGTWRIGWGVLVASLFVVARRRFEPLGGGGGGGGGVSLLSSSLSMMLDSYEQRVCEESMCVACSNMHERLLDRPIMDGRGEEFDVLVLELYNPTLVRVVGGDDCQIVFESSSSSSSSSELLTVHSIDEEGCSLSVEATGVGEIAGAAKSSAGTVRFRAFARHVRREMRDLTTEERERYLKAVHTLWHVDDEAGASRYGDKYRSTSWMTRRHLIYSAPIRCDKWHGGPSFLMDHVAFTMQFEQSIQSVDPRTAAHYWDSTIDAALGEGWVRSSMWRGDWFGTVTPKNSLHVVDEGLWAYTPLLSKARAYSNYTNAYGLLMAPWNTIKTPYLTRDATQLWGWHHKGGLVSCSLYEEGTVMATSFSSVMTFMDLSLHAKLHAWIGGAWNYLEDLESTEMRLFELMGSNNQGKWLEIKKRLWRWGISQCPQYCSEDTPARACNCELNPYFANYTAYEVLSYANMFDDLLGNVTNPPPQNDSIWGEVLRQGVNNGHQGTLLSDASPQDPVFWVIHQMQERFFHALRWYANTSTLIFDQHYGDDGSLQHDFDWTNVDGPPFLANVSKWGHYWCPGTFGNDIVPFWGLLRNAEAQQTNIEFYNMTGPFSTHTHYVYDRLTNFTQCGDIVKAYGAFASSTSSTSSSSS